MNQTLSTLLLLYACICIGMSLISWFIYHSLRTRIHRLSLFFWLSHLLNLVIQSLVGRSPHPSILALSIILGPLLILLMIEILREFSPEIQRPKWTFPVLALGYGLSLVFAFVSDNFTVITVPGLFSLGAVGLFFCWQFLAKNKGTLEVLLVIIFASFILHMMDYPFLRTNLDFAPYGYSLLIIQIVGFAALMPALSIKREADIQRKKLENLVTERSAQLLQQSKLSALGEMAAGVAHEINNPLAIITGRVEQISRRMQRHNLDPQDLKESILVIEKTSYRISKIIKSLMDFSRQGHNIPFSEESISNILSEVSILCEEKFRYKGVEFHSDCQEDFLVKTRGPQISQVLLNLLNNAFDAVEAATHEKWIKITCSKKNNKAHIEVVDSGRGIPPELWDKIMQPFVTTKEIGKGTGLGLSISKGIIDSHGGSLYLDRLATHTTFVIELPLI